MCAHPVPPLWTRARLQPLYDRISQPAEAAFLPKATTAHQRAPSCHKEAPAPWGALSRLPARRQHVSNRTAARAIWISTGLSQEHRTPLPLENVPGARTRWALAIIEGRRPHIPRTQGCYTSRISQTYTSNIHGAHRFYAYCSPWVCAVCADGRWPWRVQCSNSFSSVLEVHLLGPTA